jgi:hypothetical protein
MQLTGLILVLAGILCDEVLRCRVSCHKAITWIVICSIS